MRLFFIGDLYSNTGPAIVNKQYKKCASVNEVTFSEKKKINSRFLELIYKIFTCDSILFSGLSKQNVLGIILAKILHKKTFYLMHGYYKIESNFESKILREEQKLENYVLKKIDYIICVSEEFSENLKKDRKDLEDKIMFINNGVNKEKNLIPSNNKVTKVTYNILSVGGGMKIKNNLAICKAIEEMKDVKIKFIVIGNLGIDGQEIKKYNFVEYYDNLLHDEVLNKMSNADLYIQNSYFETFGLAVIEAIQMGCKILISKNVGAKSIIENITDDNIINNVEDINEIKEKVIKLLKDDKKERYKIKNEASWENSYKKLIRIIKEKSK